MEDGLRRIAARYRNNEISLNPCCNGRWSQTTILEPKKSVSVLILVVMEDGLRPHIAEIRQKILTCLNPCCNGRWSQTVKKYIMSALLTVLILVVMEDGLRRSFS